jgi:hypothetical protein
VRERLSLGEELSDKAIVILVCTALLWTVGVGEVDFALQQFLNRFVMAKLDPVVERDGMNGETTERYLDDMCDHVWIQSPYLPDDAEARCSINQREKGMERVVPDPMHQVAFPITGTAPFSDDSRSFADMSFVGLPEAFSGSIRYARPTLEAQILFAALPTTVNPVVYGLMTQSPKMSALHVSSYLFW